MKFLKRVLMMAAMLGCVSMVSAAVVFPGATPGVAKSEKAGESMILSNSLLTAKYVVKDGRIAFGGLSTPQGVVAEPGGELFEILTADGQTIKASELKCLSVKMTSMKAEPKALNLASRFAGKAIEARFEALDGALQISWRAVLRDGSHYLRQEMQLKSTKPLEMKGIVAMQYKLATGSNGMPVVSGNARGALIVNDVAFTALETPMGLNAVGTNTGGSAPWNAASWTTDSWAEGNHVPASLKQQFGADLRVAEGPVSVGGQGDCTVTFQYKGGDQGGSRKLNVVGVQLVNASGAVVSEDLHAGSTGDRSSNNVYTLKVPAAGAYTLRYWAETKSEPISSKGEIAFSLPVKMAQVKSADAQMVQGFWSRKTTLQPGEVWDVSSVLGLFEPGQQRRSLLAYIERERVMPYRPFIHYNSWYELNINRNNDSDPAKRMTEDQCVEVVKDWNEEMFKKRGVGIDAFVWDDGWDEFNSLWDFHKMFPNGFKEADELARKQGAGIGAWLGPVGGYGGAKSKRLANWNHHHPNNQIGNFQLSNKEYFDAFLGRCSQMVTDYDMRYFKFDGISTHFHAKGPGNEEDAEGILRVVDALRDKRGDLYINCTVGTWASPFWFRYADSVWRQENDWGDTGEGDKRDQWITYRDRLVHEVFVQGSPLMPINSMMTHGLMVTKFGPPACMPRDPENVKKEMRCAFACGTSLQELYVDRDLMGANNGELWDELAKGIKWIRRNADVLDDVHWVGGNPWDGNKKEGSVYGWASWNTKKATLALRNSSSKEKSLTITMREALDVPKKLQGKITFKDSYDDQRKMPDFSGTAVDIDKPVTFTLKPFEVIVYEGGSVK